MFTFHIILLLILACFKFVCVQESIPLDVMGWYVIRTCEMSWSYSSVCL